jgi:hypothetical protein
MSTLLTHIHYAGYLYLVIVSAVTTQLNHPYFFEVFNCAAVGDTNGVCPIPA